MNNITYTTRKLYVKDDMDFIPTEKTPGGGVVTKIANIMKASPKIEVGTSFADLGHIALIDPLAIKDGGGWKANIEALKKSPSIKILWAEEQEILRWSGNSLADMCSAVDVIAVSNEYLSQLVVPIVPEVMPVKILYTPIDSDTFSPAKKKRQVIVVGKVGLQKNTNAIIEFYKGLPEDISKVYIGSPGMWGSVQYPTDLELQAQLKEVCDKYIESAPYSEVAQHVSRSSIYLNMSIYDVGCLSFLEAATAGCHCFCWNYHPMFDEYENVNRFESVDEGVAMVKALFDSKPKLTDKKMRTEVMAKHSYASFNAQLKALIQGVFFSE